jgi:hypothetical protein
MQIFSIFACVCVLESYDVRDSTPLYNKRNTMKTANNLSLDTAHAQAFDNCQALLARLTDNLEKAKATPASWDKVGTLQHTQALLIELLGARDALTEAEQKQYKI